MGFVASLQLLFAAAVAAQNLPPLPAGRVVERIACQSDPSQSYALYLPSAYDPARRWPALLVFDPGGRVLVALELFREPAERYGWIVMSSYDTRSGDREDPNVDAVNALWPEVHLRFATDPRRVYAAGFSAGAHLAWVLATKSGQVAGVIASGGRFIPEILPDKPSFASFAAAGDTDFNYKGTRQVDEFLARLGVPHRLEIFSGPHQWMPQELARLAVEWMELQAMGQGLRTRDDTLVEALFDSDVEAARSLETANRPLLAMRRYEEIVRTFARLHDTGEPERAVTRLRASKGCVAEAKEERRWDAFEDRWDARLSRVVGELVNLDPPPPTARLLSELEVDTLRRQAAQAGIAGTTARRLLNRAYTTSASYLAGRFLASQEIPRAIRTLEVAVAIRPESAVAWYNLACARARGGQTRVALEALTTAVDRGLKDVQLLETDPDLASLRRQDGYQTLLHRLKPEP